MIPVTKLFVSSIKDSLNILAVIPETIWTAIAMIVNMTVIIQAHLLPFNRPYDTTRYPMPTASTIAPIAIPTPPRKWARACNSAALCRFCCCCCCCCRCTCSEMKTSMGAEVKKAPKTTNEIPPKVNIIPPTIVRMAIIVTPIGRLICSVKLYNGLFD